MTVGVRADFPTTRGELCRPSTIAGALKQHYTRPAASLTWAASPMSGQRRGVVEMVIPPARGCSHIDAQDEMELSPWPRCSIPDEGVSRQWCAMPATH
jgi:hypothetical protein